MLYCAVVIFCIANVIGAIFPYLSHSVYVICMCLWH